MTRPSEQMIAILSGTMQPYEADEAVQSWLRLPVYNMAVRVLSFGTKEARRAELERIKGELVRVMVEAECNRIYRVK